MNGVNSFILYGKGGEIATNDLENQELTMLAVQLLQSCLVYFMEVTTRAMGEQFLPLDHTPAVARGEAEQARCSRPATWCVILRET